MAHQIPISRDASDPFGTDGLRALEDTRKVPTCPFEELKKGKSGNKCWEQVEQDWNNCEEIMQRKLDRNKSAAGRFSQVKDKLANAVSAVSNLLRSKPAKNDAGNGPVKNDDENGVMDEEILQQMEKFNDLCLLYNKLLANKWIKRAHTYSRFSSAEDKLDKAMTPPLLKAWYIIRPMIWFFFSFGFQSFMLHITTHFYIIYMDREKGDNKRQQEGGQLFDVVGNFVAEHLSGNTNISGEGAVYDGSVKIPMLILDASAGIPLFVCIVTYAWAFVQQKFNIGLWYKTYMVASLMAIMKGIFDVVTILPDSIGWEKCTKRLSPEGLASLRNLDFLNDFWHSLFSQLLHEVLGGGARNGSRVRYCADMMISGHTYFACLFSIAAYKQVAYNTQIPTRSNKYIRNSVFVMCILCIIVEVSLVAAARFHYTVDMLASMVMVFMLYDSKCIEQVAADWSEGYLWQDKQTFKATHWFLCCGFSEKVADYLFPKQNDEFHVIPSQTTLFNYRRIMGNEITDEPDDALDPDEVKLFDSQPATTKSLTFP